MGLYDEGVFGKIFSNRKKIFITIAAVIILILGFLIVSFVQNFSNPFVNSVSYYFRDNPLKESQNFTVLKVTVTNTTGNFAEISSVRVEADAKNDFFVGTEPVHVENILSMGPNEKREIDFSIRPNPSRTVLPGTYNFNITFDVSGETIARETAVLTYNKD